MEEKPDVITAKENMCLLSLHSNGQLSKCAFFAKVFSAIEDTGVIVDHVLASHHCIAIVMDMNGAYKEAVKIIQRELRRYCHISLLKQMALLSVGIASRSCSTGVLSSVLSRLDNYLALTGLVSYGMVRDYIMPKFTFSESSDPYSRSTAGHILRRLSERFAQSSGNAER
jgi:hypothetical protein